MQVVSCLPPAFSFEPRVYWKQPLYPTKIGIRSAYILPFSNSTCGHWILKFGFSVKKFKKMTLLKKCENLGFGLVRSTSFGRKRVCLPEITDLDFISTTPTKKICRKNSFSTYLKSPLETLPEDILTRIVCGVDHDDLKRLFHVSKLIREATLVAKRLHFEYSTPRKTIGFKNATNMENWSEFNDDEVPNAPRQLKFPRSRLSRNKLADISVALFTSDGEENWLRRELFMQMDTQI